MALTQVPTGMIEDGSITAAKLASNAVTTSKILDANVTPSKLSQPLTQGTAVATTSGTSVDFTGIPSWAKRITIMFNGVSLNSSGSLLVQLGTSSGVENTGYSSSGTNFVGNVNSTAGFIMASGNATFAVTGHMVLTLVGSNLWVASHAASVAGSVYFFLGSGVKTLAAALDRLRITSSTGTDTFDSGSVNILYE